MRSIHYFFILVLILIGFVLIGLLAGEWNPYQWHWSLRILGATWVAVCLFVLGVWMWDEGKKRRLTR